MQSKNKAAPAAAPVDFDPQTSPRPTIKLVRLDSPEAPLKSPVRLQSVDQDQSLDLEALVDQVENAGKPKTKGTKAAGGNKGKQAEKGATAKVSKQQNQQLEKAKPSKAKEQKHKALEAEVEAFKQVRVVVARVCVCVCVCEAFLHFLWSIVVIVDMATNHCRQTRL